MTTAQASSTSSTLDSLLSLPQERRDELLRSLTPAQQRKLLEELPLWRPQLGPQTEAVNSQADILGYGGQAGGGKTDLALGLAGTQHFRSIVFRRTFPQLSSIIERSEAIYRTAGDYNKADHVWRLRDGRVIELRSLQNESDKEDYQGQPHDFYEFDEATQFPESAVRFIIGWLRSTRSGQRCRVVLTFNPPTDSDGEWIIAFFGPWLDDKHPNPARPGELRWFTSVNGKEVEVSKDWRGVDEVGEEIVPLSRTFIPAKLSDNKYQTAAYRAVLQGMPEPLRSQMLFGDFKAGRKDNAWQVIPSAWVDAAQKRWVERVAREGKPRTPMTALGVDVARGGDDFFVRAPRYDNFIDELRRTPGKDTPDGQAGAALLEADTLGHPGCREQIDVIGVGGSVIDCRRKGWVDEVGDQHPGIGARAVAMNGSEGSDGRDKSGQLGYANKRADWYWSAREQLDPASGLDICLPPDSQLKADLCAVRWKLTARGIQCELKEEVIKRIGRSPDDGDAVINALAIPRMPGGGWLDMAAEAVEEKARLAALKAKKG